MDQQIININDTQIISGIEIMAVGEGGSHTRKLWVSVPPFASRPCITVNIYVAEDSPDPDTTFAPWAIEYIPKGAPGGLDLIGISTANTKNGIPYPLDDTQVVCSYLAVGEHI